MSFTALNWAYEQECGSAAAKSVLVYLSNCASRGAGDCWPSMADIVRRTELDERTTRKAIAVLIEKELIEKEHRLAENGRCISSLYRVAVVSLQPDPTPTKMQDTPTPAKMQETYKNGHDPHKNAGVGLPPVSGLPTPTKMQDPHIFDPLKDAGESLERKKEEKEESKRRESARADARGSLVVVGSNVVAFGKSQLVAPTPETILAAWNAAAAECDLPAVRVMTEPRKRKLTRRIAEVGADAMLAAIDKVRASTFCCGGNDRGWRAGMDFLLQPSSLVKVLEGAYDDRAPKLRAKPGSLTDLHQRWNLTGLQPNIEPEPDGDRRAAL